jgi:Photosynthesis system II assembly factor YCF48
LSPKLRLACLAWAALFCAKAEVVYPNKPDGLMRILDLAARDGTVFVLHEREIATSADEGVTWIRHRVPDEPRSIYFLDAARGWLVTRNGLYETQDGGNKWRRVLKSKDLLRCWFLSAGHGYAIGDRKAALETADGGKSWRSLEAATGVLSDPARTTFTSVEFSGNTGYISGHHTPKRPARDSTGRQWPQLGILIQTVDGGRTWKPTASAVFGRLAQARLSGRTAALVLQFDYEFDWPSEVYSIDLPTGETKRDYRDPEHRVCAVGVLEGRQLAVAAVKVGKSRAAGPRPLELFIGGAAVSIDERLTAAECHLQVDGASLWLATDDGFVEKLFP